MRHQIEQVCHVERGPLIGSITVARCPDHALRLVLKGAPEGYLIDLIGGCAGLEPGAGLRRARTYAHTCPMVMGTVGTPTRNHN